MRHERQPCNRRQGGVRARLSHYLLMCLLTSSSLAAGAQRPAPLRTLPPGTYELAFCMPTCEARGERVGRGVLVIGSDRVPLSLDPSVEKRLRDLSMYLVRNGGDERTPNACFEVTAERRVAGREFYVGIIRAGLTTVRGASGTIEIPLYQSPDAAFIVEVTTIAPDRFVGIGRQYDWNGDRWRAGEVEGRRVGDVDVGRCRP